MQSTTWAASSKERWRERPFQQLFKVCTALVFCLLAHGAPVQLKSAVEALEQGEAEAALRYLSGGQTGLAPVADYVAYWTAQAQAIKKNYAAVEPSLELVWRAAPASPLAGRAAVLAAKSLLELGQPRRALDALARVPRESLPQPQAFLLSGQAKLALGEIPGAAGAFQTVYYGYPLSEESAEAYKALAELERRSPEQVPPVPARLRLERAQRLMEGKQTARAGEEYERISAELSGPERDLARVRAASAAYHLRKTEAALSALRELSVASPEAEAERLYYIVACLRRLDRDTAMMTVLAEMEERVPASTWRQKALVLAANGYLVQNDVARYTPLFQACADAAPDSDDAPGCHWKVAWRSYLERRPEARARLREHLTNYPGSEKAGAAIYYLGRLAELASDYPAAKSYWAALQARFPNYYYALLSRDRMRRPEVARAEPSPEVEEFLAAVRFPERVRQGDFELDPATARRLERARLLARAGLDTWAEAELRFGTRNGEKTFPLVVELAESAARRGAYDVSIRYILGTLPNYLFLARDGVPARFWKLAFPFPYRAKIERYARAQNLDPFLVAALIRQESLFDHDVVSYAKAIGLMQVMPGTGRELGRKVGLGNVRPVSLKDPDTNLKIGTYYLRRQLDARDGNVEETLAGYNAGPTRIPMWRGWADYREPGEFVENIPFTQTRDYVQIITRNADIYRWLYANDPAPTGAAEMDSAPTRTVPAKAAAKTPAKSRTKGKASVRRKK